ncbi:hypothetical protein STEG23_017810 [Scotinomys teguina]
MLECSPRSKQPFAVKTQRCNLRTAKSKRVHEFPKAYYPDEEKAWRIPEKPNTRVQDSAQRHVLTEGLMSLHKLNRDVSFLLNPLETDIGMRRKDEMEKVFIIQAKTHNALSPLADTKQFSSLDASKKQRVSGRVSEVPEEAVVTTMYTIGKIAMNGDHRRASLERSMHGQGYSGPVDINSLKGELLTPAVFCHLLPSECLETYQLLTRVRGSQFSSTFGSLEKENFLGTFEF